MLIKKKRRDIIRCFMDIRPELRRSPTYIRTLDELSRPNHRLGWTGKDHNELPRPPALDGVHIISYCWNLPFSIRRGHGGFRGILFGESLSKLVIENGFVPKSGSLCGLRDLFRTPASPHLTGPTAVSERCQAPRHPQGPRLPDLLHGW